MSSRPRVAAAHAHFGAARRRRHVVGERQCGCQRRVYHRQRRYSFALRRPCTRARYVRRRRGRARERHRLGVNGRRRRARARACACGGGTHVATCHARIYAHSLTAAWHAAPRGTAHRRRRRSRGERQQRRIAVAVAVEQQRRWRRLMTVRMRRRVEFAFTGDIGVLVVPSGGARARRQGACGCGYDAPDATYVGDCGGASAPGNGVLCPTATHLVSVRCEWARRVSLWRFNALR